MFFCLFVFFFNFALYDYFEWIGRHQTGAAPFDVYIFRNYDFVVYVLQFIVQLGILEIRSI